MAAIDRFLNIGNATQHRFTSAAVSVPRIFGKIALEEHVGTTIWSKHNITPPSNQLFGIGNQAFPSVSESCLHSPSRFSQLTSLQPNGLDTIARLNDMANISSRLESMDNSGIGYVIVSQSAPNIQGVLDTANATKFATEINDEMYATYTSVYPDRFGFFAVVPMQDPLAAATELERSVTKLHAKGAAINGYTDIGPPENATVRYLDDPLNEPFWSKVAELNVPVYLHPRAPPPSQQMMYNNANYTHSAYPGLVTGGFGFTAEVAVHSMRLMLSGLFDRHPSIQIILGHAAEGLPFLIHRSDHQLAHEAPGVNGPHTRPLRYYLKTNFYATLSGVRRLSTVQCTLAEMGEERVMFSADYPFMSNEDQADWFDRLEGVGVATKRNIARGNAKRLLRIGVELDERQVDEEFM
jgi:predicted TIM-barrel fold metal-dependent hydrolase